MEDVDCLTTFLLNLSEKMGLVDRDPEAITKHTQCAINAFNNNDPGISVDFFLQEELASVERALVRRNSFLSLVTSFIFSMVIAVIVVIVIAIATTSNGNLLQAITLVVTTLVICALGLYFILKDRFFLTRNIVNFDIVSIEENRLNKALCAYACCPCS